MRGTWRKFFDRTGLHPTVQRLLSQGKEKDNNEFLHIAVVQDMSNVLEDPASKERNNIQNTSVSCEAVAGVRVEVDKLSHRVCKYSCKSMLALEFGIIFADDRLTFILLYQSYKSNMEK